MEWSNQQIAQWRHRWVSYLSDTSSVALHQEVYRRRQHVQQEMLLLLHAFLDGAITLKEFNAAFQQKTHGEWYVFGLRGLSGGMFLNKLVKYVSDKKNAISRLQTLLRAPVASDIRYGQRRMQAFVRFLDGLIVTQQVTRAQLQPSRVPFLLSAWWHLQDTEQWPIFYPIVHAVLAHDEGESTIVQDPTESYFVFRRRFLSLAKALDVSSWELEHLCTWYGQKHLKEQNVSRENALALSTKRRLSLFSQEHSSTLTHPSKAISPVDILAVEVVQPKDEDSSSSHTHIQWLLAKIGQKVGCQVWIAINDHSKVWKHERRGDLSLKSLPILRGSEFQRIIS